MSEHRPETCMCAACLTPEERAWMDACWLRDQTIKARRAGEQRAEAERVLALWEQEARMASTPRSDP